MQGLAEQMNGEAGLLQRGKQPRPLEDGNWVCDDPSCGNVNYPRRTEVSHTRPILRIFYLVMLYTRKQCPFMFSAILGAVRVGARGPSASTVG
jgi:hypothetical protein